MLHINAHDIHRPLSKLLVMNNHTLTQVFIM